MARIGFTVGNIFRETGIALERLGSRLQGDYSYTDTCKPPVNVVCRNGC